MMVRPGLEMDHQDMITDITLDHLPDLSDASVSFQIPSNNASADLLADHTDGFDVLCHAIVDDASFAPVNLRHPRGPPLTLGELTPRVLVAPRSPHHSRSPTPTPVLASSAKPSVIRHPLTLGRRSPDKPRKTPSRTKSIHRQLESPLVSSERFQQLRAEVETLGREDNVPTRVGIHVMEFPGFDSVEGSSSSNAQSKVTSNARDDASQPQDLPPPAEEKDMRQNVEPPADQDVVMATGESCHADATNVVVLVPAPKSKRNPRTSKSAVAAGGISKRTAFPVTHMSKKAKGKPPRVQEERPVPPSAVRQPTPPQSIDTDEGLVPPACMGGDMDSKPEKTQITHTSTGGLAERLVSYSQKLISSIGLYKHSPENSSVEAPDDAVRLVDARIETQPPADAIPPSLSLRCINDIPITRGKPFRLSEISPRKLPPNALPPISPANFGSQDGGQHATSPMRPAKKRISTDVDQPQDYRRRKRGKMMPADVGHERGSSKEAVSQGQPLAKKATHVYEDRSATHPETRESMQRLGCSKMALPNPRTKYKPKLVSPRCTGPVLDAFPYVSRSRQEHERISRGKRKREEGQSNAASVRSGSSLSGFSVRSSQRQDRKIIQENAAGSSHVIHRSGPTSTVDLPLVEKKQNATLCVAQRTAPVGFTFRVDARLEARKAEERLAASEPGKTHHLPPVPRNQAHRVSHQAASIIHRPEGVVPSVAVAPFFFYTEQRAKEREKFDEMVKRKEEEMQRLKEEQRRREAEEEERAIKALRRKAVPKANEIPEWYADMPKRKETAV